MNETATIPSAEQIAHRLRVAANGRGASAVARDTGASRETVRRYMTSGHPSVAFLAEFCIAYNANPAWILFGHEPRELRFAAQSPSAYATAELVTELRRRLGEDLQPVPAPLRFDVSAAQATPLRNPPARTGLPQVGHA